MWRNVDYHIIVSKPIPYAKWVWYWLVISHKHMKKGDVFLTQKKKWLRRLKRITFGFIFLLFILFFFVAMNVEKWSDMGEGRLPAKTAVILHAISEQVVTPDVKPPKFFRSTSGSKMVREEINIPLNDGKSIQARVYRPKVEKQYPIIMYYHGGAFMEGYGSVETHENIAQRLAQRTNSVVVSVGYRVAPQYIFPTAIEDSFEALLWVEKHAEQLHGDRNKIAVAGDSAGGNIATVVAAVSRDRDGPNIIAQVLYYPLTTFLDVEYMSRSTYASGYYLLSRSVMLQARAQYTPEEAMWYSPYTSPLDAEDLAKLPQTLIMTAEFDPLRDEGEMYGKRLASFGVPTTVVRYNGVMHGFISFYEVMQSGRHGLEQSIDFLSNAFNGNGKKEHYSFEIKNMPMGAESIRDQAEAYAIASYIIGKKTLARFMP